MYHENYVDWFNDLGFIYLSKATEKILESPFVGLITLSTSEDAEVDLSGKIATVSGYGIVSDSGESATGLNYAKLPVESNEECKNCFGSLIKNSHICVDTKGGSSACNGESCNEIFQFVLKILNLP